MLDYSELKDKGGLAPWPAMSELPFINVLSGDPQHRGRHDFGDFESRLQVGVWECSPGSFEYTYPGDEICTLLAGRIRVTDADGVAHEFSAGDSFFTTRGETVTWEVLETVRKVFHIHNRDGN